MVVQKKDLALVRQNFASAALGHKIQEVASDRKEKKAKRIDGWNIFIVSGVVALLAMQSITPSNPLFTYVGLALSVFEIVLLIVQLKMNNEREAVTHKNTARKYMALRDQYRILIADVLNDNLPAKTVVLKRDELQREYQTISSLAPQTSDEDYDEAMKRMRLVKDQQNIWSDKQIDMLLPKELRFK